jgi:hypothetical protein
MELDEKTSPLMEMMKKLGFSESQIAENIEKLRNGENLYLNVVVSKGENIFESVKWDDVERRFIEYINNLPDKEYIKFIEKYGISKAGKLDINLLNQKYFDILKNKEPTLEGYKSMEATVRDFFDNEIRWQYGTNDFYLGTGFTGTVSDGIMGTGEMVLKNEGDCLPITAGSSKYNVYRYTVDENMNFTFVGEY